jgi:hypothetical protein
MRFRWAFSSGVTLTAFSLPLFHFLILTFLDSRNLGVFGVVFAEVTDFRRTGGVLITTRGEGRVDIVGRTRARQLQQYVEAMTTSYGHSNGLYGAEEEVCEAVVKGLADSRNGLPLFTTRGTQIKAALKIL